MLTLLYLLINCLRALLFGSFPISAISCIKTKQFLNTIIHFLQNLLAPPPTDLPRALYLCCPLDRLLKVSKIPKPFLTPRYMCKMEQMQQFQCWDLILLWPHVTNHNCAVECNLRKHPIARQTLKLPPTPQCRGIDSKRQRPPSSLLIAASPPFSI